MLFRSIGFTVDAFSDRQFSATLTRLAPTVDPVTRRVQARASVVNSDRRLRPEMFARALPGDAAGAQGVQLPASALLQVGAKSVVFVQQAANRFEQRDVQIAAQQGGLAWIRAGLVPGEQVVTVGSLLLKSELQSR